MKNKKSSKILKPFVSVCTPTFNRRPFIETMIKCFQHQTYPKNRMEWIIIDDGTDKIEDLITHIKEIKYFKFDEKMTLGKKRNLLNQKSIGDIIVYMDDDDYYPPERISHAVEMLQKNPSALCAGSSTMLIYFKHISKMYQFGPYGLNHSTAATFAFRKKLLTQTSFNEVASVAEEKHFLKNYTIPFVQLDFKKTILVVSHDHNSFDKKILLKQLPNQFITESKILTSDIIKEPEILNFFMNDVDKLLELYDPGKLEYKPDVIKQIKEMTETREKLQKEQMLKQQEYQNIIQQPNNNNNNNNNYIIQQLRNDNKQLQEKIEYLENKITSIITKIKNQKLESSNIIEIKTDSKTEIKTEIKLELSNIIEPTIIYKL